jgi:tetratricopeptide (TPR) repeat protein
MAVPCRVRSGQLLTREDLDSIGHAAFSAEDPGAVAAELVEAIEQGRVANAADNGYALLLAAEIAERTGDLAGALGLVQRGVAAYHASDDTEYGFPLAYQAELLLRMGRDEEAMTQLAALRPLLGRDPDAASYLSEALEAGGRAELAVQWLTAALEAALPPPASLAGQRPESAHAGAAGLVYTLAQQRHRLRRDLGWSHDDYDDLADRLRAMVAEELDEEDYGATAVLFWPAAEFDQLLARWPVPTGRAGIRIAPGWSAGWCRCPSPAVPT